MGKEGYQAHEEFAFLHVGARYYDPGSGRFLQRDPIGFEGGMNVYAYADLAPTMRIDPTGEFGIFGFEFNKEWASHFWSDTGKGAAAAADGFIPLADPFKDYYDIKKDPGTKWSRRGGKFAYLCITIPRALGNVKGIAEKIRDTCPNPPPFVSPFEPL